MWNSAGVDKTAGGMYRRRFSSGGRSVLDYDPLEEEQRRETKRAGPREGPDPYAQRIHEVKDEREDVQKKTFAKWINSQLVKGQHPPVTDLFYDLRDGTRLLALLEVLTNKTYKREKGRMRVHHLNNVSRALNILEEHNVKLVNISNEHIVDGSAKLTLGLVWAIILHWQVQGVLKDVMSDLQQTNLEKTLLAWCRQTTKGYHGVDVRNFTTSWTDGLAFNALIHSHRPQLFDWTVMARKHPYARLENAFRLANENLNIERLLDPEDVNSQVPDKKSIMMYVMCLFQALPHGSFTMESLDVALQSDSSLSVEGSGDDASHIAAKARPLSTASIGLSEYQRTLEEVLTWLLGAEDRLAAMPPIADTTEAVKDQFHDLEELMLELTSKQGGIGDVLGEGSRLMREGVMEEEEEEEVRVQMKLLNTRWEELRVKAMDRQSSLHEKLMSLQQKQLESLKKWLTDTEDRIANMSQVGPTTEILRQQISAHQSLQKDLENEQSNINSLSNMVVVVDESSSDSAYSTLEDELNALGERWAHICRWAESRWTTLQTLSIHWEHFEQEMDKLRQWLHEKETTLRQVESNPSSEQEHILRHASMLQVLQAEMEVQHRCICHLEEESSKILTYIPEESPAHENILAEIESIQDRMDCLVSMIEAQTQRMAASGIDITKVMAPVDDSTNVLSSSTTTISHEGATVITKIITTKVTETVKGNVVKRQKLEGSSQEDFSVALHQLGGWMDSMEAQIKPRAIEELTLEQLSQICQQVESEMESQKEEYYKVVSLGESAISETSTIGESSKESEQQVANVSSRWEAITEMLIEIRTRITFLTQKKKIATELSDLEVHYQGFLRWFENVRTVSENEPNAVTLQAEQCKSKIATMESHNKDITALRSATNALNQKWAQETNTLTQQIDAFYSKWEILVQRFLEWNETLKHKLAEAATPSAGMPPKPVPESLLKAMGASSTWLESLEAALANEYTVSTLPQMQDYLTKFKDLSEKVEMEQGNMAHINETCHKLGQDGHVNIMEDITKLNKQWETTTEALQLRIKSIEKVIEKQKQYNDEVSGLKSWLAEVDIFLQAEEAALGDIETLEAQLEQSNALQDDVATLQTNVNNITTTGKELIEEGDSELKNIVKSQLVELTTRWDLVTELARAQNKSLKEALARSQKVHDGIDKLNEWLDELEPKIPANIPRNTPEELSIAVETFTHLREDISIHSDDLRAINNIGDEMLQLDSSATHEELARRFTQLNGRWTDVVSQVDSKYKVYITAAQHYEDFKKVCFEESEWLDQLQAKLERSSKDAADAEEISEALDELEIFLHSHDESRLEQIRSLAESLVREGCVSEPVQEITRSLTSRFDTLNAQASEQQSGLEGCVQEAQAWEREYVSVLDYLAQSDLILTQAITDQIQVDQIQVQAELLTQQDVLKKMQAQVEVYHSQGKTEAALRLEDQITHLQKKYEEIEMKLHICRKPSDFDTRFNEVNEQLQEIGHRVHLVNVDSGDPEGIQEQLNQCLDLYQTLSEVKSEVESVIATGRKIVKEGQSTDPDGLTLQLDQLKALYNKLGGTVTEHRGILEKALRHSRKIQKDSSHLEEWLSTTECELDQREATVPAKNIEGEVQFAEHAIDDLGRKKPLLTGLHESYAALASLSDDSASLHPIKEQVDDIALSWERVNIRLANRLKNMQVEQMAKEAEMEKFIIGLGEIKGWLESTEYQLLHLSKLEPSEQDKLIKSVSSEIQSYKGQIENTRDTAVGLINHGVLFQARIQPELLLINQRWENIYRTVQVMTNIETPAEPALYQAAQDLPITLGENLVFTTQTTKADCIEKSVTDSFNQLENFHRKISTASVETDFTAREVAATFESPGPPSGSFAFERGTLVSLHAQPTDNIVTISHNVQLIDGQVCAENPLTISGMEDQNRKISTASMEIEFGADEVAGVLDMSSHPTQSFADETQMFVAASHYFPNQAVASEIVPLSASGDKDIVIYDRKIYTASRENVFAPQEVVLAIPTPFLQAEAFTFPKEVSVSLEGNLETGIVLSEVVPLKDSCSGTEITGKHWEANAPTSSANNTSATSKTERKLSSATRDFEIMPLEITEDLETEVEATAFAMSRSVSERAMESLKEAILISPETILQGSPYPDEKHTIYGREISCLNKHTEEINRKILTASVEMELAPYEMLLEEEQALRTEKFAYTRGVIASACESSFEDVVIATVKTAIDSTITGELISPEVNGEPPENMETTSEISEEGLPLGCEAAFIDPSVISGYDIKSQSGEGSDFGEITADDLAFVRGVKSAIPTGYTFTTNTAEDDCLSEALSYFDIETSVDVQDRYGVAVTVIGTRSDLNVAVEDTEEKQIPLEEGGLEELKIESSFSSFLKSSQYSTMDTSLDNRLLDREYKDTKEVRPDFCVADDAVNRSTFLTEVVSFTDKEYLEKALQKPRASALHPIDQTSVQESQKYDIKKSVYNTNLPSSVCVEKVVSAFQSSKEDEETEGNMDIEKPFKFMKYSMKVPVTLDNLQNIPETIVPSVKDAKVKVKKEEISSEPGPESKTKLHYVPLSPPTIIYGSIAKKKDDNQDETKLNLAKTVLNQDTMTRVQYTPKSQVVTKVGDSILKLESGIVIAKPLEQGVKYGVVVQPQCDEHVKELSTQQVVDNSHEVVTLVQKDIKKEPKEYLTDRKISSKLPATPIHYVPHVPVDSDTNLQDKKSIENLQYIPCVSSDIFKEIQQEMKNISQKETSTSKINETTEIVSTIHTKDNINILKEKDSKIHYVPHAPSDILKTIPEENLAVLKEMLPKIILTKQEQPNICSTPVDAKNETIPPKDVKSSEARKKEGGPIVINKQAIKSVEMKFTKESCITKENKEDEKSKILYVPHVPVSVATSLALPQEQGKETLIFIERDLSSIRETDIISDDDKITSAPIKKEEIESKKAKDIKIHYSPYVPVDQRVPQETTKPGSIRTNDSEQKTNAKESISFVKSENLQKTVVGIPKHQTSDKKTESIIEKRVHVPVSESMDTETPEKQKKESYDIHYVPYVIGGLKISPFGALPKEIHYVPHSPADLEKIKSEKTYVKPPNIPSGIITSPSTSKLDAVAASSSDISKNLKKQSPEGSVTGNAGPGISTSEKVYASRRYVKESTQEQVHVVTSAVATIPHDIQRPGQSVQQELGDEVDAFLREVTANADKITEIKTKLQTIPSYQDAKEKAETLEQEVALLEPDVATVISHGDTLTLTTHMVDVPRANTIRIAVNDLRTHWSSLKSETEIVKLESEQVDQEIKTISGKADDIISWLNDVPKRLHLLNNDESQLEALENEMTNKKAELDKLNESGSLLKKYKYNQIQPVLTLLNMRWTEVSMQFRQYRKGSLEKKSIVSTTKVESPEREPVIVPDFVASVNRLREAISVISRQLNSTKLSCNQYDNLKMQEDELKSIKKGLETLKPRVDGLESERNATVRNITPAESEQVRRVMDKLREEWAQVNRGYTEKHARWLQCSETWRTLQKTIDDFSVWLDMTEEKVQCTSNQPLPDAKITQKELEKQVTLKHRPSQTLQNMCKEVTEGMNADDGKRLQERVDNLMKRWRALLLDLAARRERIASEEGGKEMASSEHDALTTWVEQAQALMDAPVNVTDEASLSAHTTMVQNHLMEMTAKQNLLKKLKDSKTKSVTSTQMSTLETSLNKVVKTLPDYKNMVDTKLGVIKTLVADVESLYKWTEEMRVKVALRNLTEEEIKQTKMTLREKEAVYENLDSTYWVLAQDAEVKGLTVAVALKNRMNTIESRLKALQGQVSEAGAAAIPPTPTSPTFPTPLPPYSAGGRQKVDQEKAVKQERGAVASMTETSVHATGTTVTSSVTSVIQNVIKFEESVMSTEGALRPPSPLVDPPRHAPDTSPVLILASLDKSILQIRDWLTLMEQMTRQQTVVVGDADDIRQLTEKQKSVLRELEGKKPQLDELVASADSLKDDASRTQLHQKVSKLREHWDETNSVVLARKTQLDAMYSDTHKFDAKRSELESWLARMEARLDRMAPVARTADVLDQQIREQKGFHAEIHQYKHQVELFNQMTQRLIAIYQHDDTRRLKKITETINLRYSSLNSSIIARGKELHSAMNSLHNFDKALDKFASWMSDAESNTDLVELEVDKLGPARRDPQARAPVMHLKDLQSEIESHKDVLASLNATGQKLLGTLENQDEAVMLQRRLEEMNQRWNTLKHKSIAIRNRLEGNSENWNSLLLSLRELIEWVIRKDTELTALGPLVGDLNTLAKFSEDLSSFRRVIDEKQPVIESNLKSGRQLIASEPPLSDTSDSEAGRELDGDARYRGDENARDLTRSVRREVAKLSEKWAALRERAAAAAAQADLAYKKLGVLQKTVEEVSGRLQEAEKTAESWGPVSQDPNLADQHAHNVRKFREGLADLQRGVDDVNDQAARFSAHNVPLTPANSARLHDLNNRWKTLETTVNDRWRQVAGRSREVTPLTPAQLASSVSPPWERATTSNKVPYYINHDQESTHWDHPIMMDLLDSLTEFNHIKFSAYRTATKLRMLQKKLALDRAKMQMATDIFDEHGLRGQNDRLIDVGDMVVVLSALYANISADHPDVNTTLAMDLCLNWLLNVYDSQRTGQMRVLSFKIGLVCLCRGHLEEKYRYMFRLIADPNRLVDQRKLGLLLHDCVQVPRQLGEVAAFGGSNIEPSVRSCFTKAGKDRETIEAVHFLTWVQQEPQSLVWLAVLHRVAASESIQHQVKCNICKACPIIGLRYRCLKCLSFDMCQRCFFDGRSGKSHKITHPMHEYCTATTAGEDMKDFTKALKNKFKSKRSLQKHTKKGYLPVQTVLEGDPLESPSPSPQHNVTSQDMHSRLELYASRLAEVELRTNSNSTPDSEDEHGLIAQYCQSLSSSDAPLPVPRSPLQIMAAVDAEQKDELEQMIRALEEENSVLQAEYDRLKSQQPVGSPPDDGLGGQRSEADMLAEAKLLRQHKGRLEARMGILEEHNRQLEAQLHRLRQLLGEPGGMSSPNKSGTLQTKSVTASQLAMDSPAKINGHSTQGASSAYDGLDQMSEYVRPPPPPMGNVAHVGNLFSRAGDLGKAVGTLVATMTQEGESDLPSDEEDSDASDAIESKAV